MKRSKGLRNRTRHKLCRDTRRAGVLPVSRMMQDFKVGRKVSIVIEPSIHKGQPHPRFHGAGGVVVKKEGGSYLVEIKDGNARKRVVAKPVHLRAQG